MESYSDKVMEHFRNPRNVGEIPDASGIGKVGNPVCVSPDTIIYKNSAIRHIKNLVLKDKVLGHDGFYHRIKKIYKRIYRGPVFHIDIHNLGSLLVTPLHHILSLKTRNMPRKHRDYKKAIKDWHMASELKKGDTILIPILKGIIDKKFLKFDIEKADYDFKSKWLPTKIKITEEFLRLIGYYLAEGSVITKKCKGIISFTLGVHEENIIEDIVDIMNKCFKLKPNAFRSQGNSKHIIYYSARLARFFKHNFGKGAQNKCLPHWALILPSYKQKAILCGLWRGDGYIRARGGKYVTISKILAHQIKLLLMRQKIVFSFLTVPEKGMHKENYCIYIRSRESIRKIADIVGKRIEMSKKLKLSQKAWYDNNFFYVTIGKITNRIYKGLVYNLGVKNCYSYVSEAATLHNCGDIMNLYIKVDENKVISDAKFKTFGCGAAIATSSMVTELVKGKTVDEALRISNSAVAQALGGLPPIKMHCSMLAEQALKSAIEDYLKKSGKNKFDSV